MLYQKLTLALVPAAEPALQARSSSAHQVQTHRLHPPPLLSSGCKCGNCVCRRTKAWRLASLPVPSSLRSARAQGILSDRLLSLSVSHAYTHVHTHMDKQPSRSSLCGLAPSVGPGVLSDGRLPHHFTLLGKVSQEGVLTDEHAMLSPWDLRGRPLPVCPPQGCNQVEISQLARGLPGAGRPGAYIPLWRRRGRPWCS